MNGNTRLGSERIVTQAPMSFTGALKRTRRLFAGGAVWLFWVVGLPLLLLWWTLIVGWYLCFGLVLVPYRLMRRGQRRRRLEDARHREVLEAMTRPPS